MKVNRMNPDAVVDIIMKRKLKALPIAGAIVQSQAKALVSVGKYPKGSGKVGGALRDSIYMEIVGDVARIGSNLEYAAMQEFGGVITPYRAKALTIPIAPEAVGHKASEFKDLFILKANNQVFLAKNEAEGLKIMYILLKSVTIPKHPYLRPALEIKKKEVIKILQAA